MMTIEFFEQLKGIMASKTNIMSIFTNNKLRYIVNNIDGKWYIPSFPEYYTHTYVPTDIYGVINLIKETKDISEIRLGTSDGKVTKLPINQ